MHDAHDFSSRDIYFKIILLKQRDIICKSI